MAAKVSKRTESRYTALASQGSVGRPSQLLRHHRQLPELRFLTFIVSKRGMVRERVVGPVDEETLVRNIEALVAQS